MAMNKEKGKPWIMLTDLGGLNLYIEDPVMSEKNVRVGVNYLLKMLKCGFLTHTTLCVCMFPSELKLLYHHKD